MQQDKRVRPCLSASVFLSPQWKVIQSRPSIDRKSGTSLKSLSLSARELWRGAKGTLRGIGLWHFGDLCHLQVLYLKPEVNIICMSEKNSHATHSCYCWALLLGINQWLICLCSFSENLFFAHHTAAEQRQLWPFPLRQQPIIQGEERGVRRGTDRLPACCSQERIGAVRERREEGPTRHHRPQL